MEEQFDVCCSSMSKLHEKVWAMLYLTSEHHSFSLKITKNVYHNITKTNIVQVMKIQQNTQEYLNTNDNTIHVEWMKPENPVPVLNWNDVDSNENVGNI